MSSVRPWMLGGSCFATGAVLGVVAGLSVAPHIGSLLSAAGQVPVVLAKSLGIEVTRPREGAAVNADASPYAARKTGAEYGGSVSPTHISPTHMRSTEAVGPIAPHLLRQPLRVVRETGSTDAGNVGGGLDTQSAIARDVQRALKRAGCQLAQTDGRWGENSRNVMGLFLRNANASLPTTQPDLALLALVRGYAGKACGRGCGAGRQHDLNGKCVAIETAAAKPKVGGRAEAGTRGSRLGEIPERAIKPPQPTLRWTAVVRRSRPVSSVEARTEPVPMAPVRVTQAGTPHSAPSHSAAAPQAAKRNTVSAPSYAPTSSRLPGRMALGLPRPPAAAPATLPTALPPTPRSGERPTGAVGAGGVPESPDDAERRRQQRVERNTRRTRETRRREKVSRGAPRRYSRSYRRRSSWRQRAFQVEN